MKINIYFPTIKSPVEWITTQVHAWFLQLVTLKGADIIQTRLTTLCELSIDSVLGYWQYSLATTQSQSVLVTCSTFYYMSMHNHLQQFISYIAGSICLASRLGSIFNGYSRKKGKQIGYCMTHMGGLRHNLGFPWSKKTGTIQAVKTSSVTVMDVGL